MRKIAEISDAKMRACVVGTRPRLDFVDTLLYAYHALKGARVFTFDKKLLSRIKKKGDIHE